MNSRIEIQRNILDFTLSSLLRRKTKNAVLMVVFTIVVFMLASIIFFTNAVKREAVAVLQNSPDIVVQRLSAGRHDLIPADYIKTITDMKGVVSVKGRHWGYYFEPAASANFTLVVPDDGGEEGRIVAGKGVSRTMRAGDGDILPLKSYKGEWVVLSIKGVLKSDSELVSSDLIEISEKDFRKIFGIPKDRFTDLSVTVRNPKETLTIAKKIKDSFPDTRPILRSEVLRTYDSLFNWRSGLLLIIAAGAVLAFIIFAFDRASGLSAEERREIGILKAIGWETSDVIAFKFWEGLVISLSSFMAGIILAYFHVFVAYAPLFEPVLKGWAVLYPEFRLVPFIDPFQIATLFFLTVLPYTAATIIPSWRSAVVDPDQIMRSQ
ncbi:MAG: FtsX-like permease family protein [Nitrospirae bacterium]|nr:FtsX-like permease family protein [Nitrospirota bacterium]